MIVSSPSLTVADLERILHEAEPAALLVPPRILRRVIKQDRHLGGLGLQVPHRKSYSLGRDALLRVADRSELGLAADRELPAVVLLFPLPDPARLASRPREEILLETWRLLFHAHVHLAMARRRVEGSLTEGAVGERIARIGTTEFDEVCAVLRQEHFLLSPDDVAAVYEEFAAVYLELRCFAPDRLGSYFPGIADLEAVDRLLAEDVDAGSIFAATRLAGAPDPVGEAESAEDESATPANPAKPRDQRIPSDDPSVDALKREADQAAHRGDRVAAALHLQRVAVHVPPAEQQAALDAAHSEIQHLLSRLGDALQMPASELDAWREPLFALLEVAASDFYPVEARFLYDLQNVCIDRERDVYAVDLVEWIVSLGHRPIKRLLPNQPLILGVKHLHTALHRLNGVRIAEPLRLELVRLMTAAAHRGEHQVRERFRPVILLALEKVGLKPDSYAERVSRDKLVEELLDRIVKRRFLGMGDLRDAIARNQLKLPDLSGPLEFLSGDKLIRANRQFADDLDGVYRRGEIYLRWLQRLSSAAFGTRTGRFLVLYLVLPFGGAFLGLEGLHHVVELFHKHEGPQARIASTWGLLAAPDLGPLLASSTVVAQRHDSLHMVNRYSVAALGLFLFALLHVPWFGRGVVRAIVRTWRGLVIVFHDWPRAFLRLPWVRRFLESRAYLFFYQYVLKPLPWAGGVALICHLLGLGLMVTMVVGAGVFVLTSVLVNSRLGQHVEEVFTDGAVRTWDLFSRDVVPGLFRLVMSLFKRLLEDVERVLYAVDVLLRFRTGDSRFSLVWKPALGLAWFFVTYLIRLFINLFVEPTFNPIKHFPVVTVTAKLIVPIIKPLTEAIVELLVPLGVPAALAYTVAGSVIFFLPGLAGFLVWELKENWRLYRSNRSATLEPVVVGSHGETVARLLRPGLHSGTVPKIYARLRRAWGAAAHKQYEALHHVQDSLRHFVERDLLAVLAGSRRWNGTQIEVGDRRLSTNRIRFELRCSTLGGESVCLDFEEHAGRLTAGITFLRGGLAESWLPRLQPAQTAALHDALAGFCKQADVELLREPVEDVSPGGKWPFAETQVRWSAWVNTWELDQAGKEHQAPLVGETLLPNSR